MPSPLPRRRRARPVADAPIDALLARGRELTKGWLLALIEDAPLEGAPGVLGPRLVAEGPLLCDALLRALADDLELRRLAPGGECFELGAAVGELAGAAGDAAAIVRAVDALRAVMWAALRTEVAADDGELIADLAERLEQVCGVLRLAALERRAVRPSEPAVPPSDPVVVPSEPVVVPSEPVVPPSEPAMAAPPPAAPPPGRALWVGALDDEIGRARAGPARPLSLLVAELEDAERLAAADGAEVAGSAFAHFATALRGAVRPQDILVSESDSRAWIIARDTPRTDAYALGARVADAVEAGPPWRGAPLTASVGLAVLGQDGSSAGELIEAAEESRFAASASGRDIAR